jgi:hypothetical protein
MLRHSLHRFLTLVFSCGVVSCGLGACSIHPLPKDVTGYSTATIVRKIRCEARDAVINAAIEIMHGYGGHREVTEEESLHQAMKGPLNRWENASLTDLGQIAIVYNFTLEGVETDSLTFNADIIKPLRNGSELYSPSLGDALKRDNTRTFTISDTFTTLWNLNPKRHCDFRGSGSGPNSSPNYQYPIAGRIGLDEMIQTFVRMSVSGDLVTDQGANDSTKASAAPADTTTDDSQKPATPPATSPAGSKKSANAAMLPLAGAPKAPAPGAADGSSEPLTPAGSPTMVDTLIFTTTINAGLTPKITLSPIGTALQLEDATLVGSVMRVDTHTVSVALALSKSSNTPSAAAVTSLLNPNTAALFFTHQPKGNGLGEKLALQALVQDRLRRDLRNRASFAVGGP